MNHRESPIQELTKLSEHPAQKQLFKMLTSQIEKDLIMCGIEWKNASNVTPSTLIPAMEIVINNLLKHNYKNDIRMFLYRVDVNEKLLRQIENLNVDEIVNLVIRREIEKIWMKYKYSNV